MGLISLVHADLIKQRHTAYFGIHTLIPIVGAALFTFYYLLYKAVDELQRLKLLLELTAMVFPVLIGIIVGLNILQEEKAGRFQNILATPHRAKIMLSKFFVLYFSGIFSLFALFILFAAAAGTNEFIPFGPLIQSVLGLALGNFAIYVLHLFLSLKFGLAISLFWGVFECLQCILFSNIELHGLWRYVPFSWSVNCVHDILNGKIASNSAQRIMISILSVGALLAFLYWFTRWEGRKNYE